MKEILQNLALIHLIDYCKKQKIDPSGTHIYKYPKRWTYALIKDETGKAIANITFHKSSVPIYSHNK